MKTIISLLFENNKRTLFAIAGLILLAAACSKDQSKNGSGSGPVNIFTTQFPTDPPLNDGKGGIEVGLKFQSQVPGYVDGIRFYKTLGDTGTPTGQRYAIARSLFSSKGLAT